MRKMGKALLGLAALLTVVVLGYVAYAYSAYYRLEDRLPLAVENNPAQQLRTECPYQAMSYNVGFFAYSADYSFFMDGGTESRARDKSSVERNMQGALAAVAAEDADFRLFQEVDVDATRSHHINELEGLLALQPAFGSVFAQNYDSPYLFWPMLRPHGASRSGMVTLARFQMSDALRRSLPVETGFTKFYDLDRCYSVTRLPVEGGGELCLYNVHLSAYTSDGVIATQQLELLLADMAAEYEAGNYVVCGGDFNKDLLGDSAAVFGVAGEYTWAQSFPVELVPEGLTLVAPRDEGNPVPSCRNANEPYDPATSFQLTVDGFVVSDNVEVTDSRVVDTGFAWSDHNPVTLTFLLGSKK